MVQVRRLTAFISLCVLLFSFAACTNKRVNNPIAQVDSKQPDKILYDRAMDALKHNKYDVARLTLQTLINTYPDSEYVARAKLAVGDSWYAEGGSAAMVQAENEYKDFITFFPNMPEAAEAQLKIANIHYREMEKPDRDFTHAKRAEEEYRSLLMQFPDSKLVPEAKARLLEVQEVLAEREFRIGKFYYLRQSLAAAEARLKSLVDTYPLYSGADEALYMLADTYVQRAAAYRAVPNLPEVMRGELIKKADESAATAYARIITRYPITPRAEDAKRRLTEMHRPVPTPTPQAIAQNKREEESRGKTGMWGGVMNNLRKGPDVAQSTKVGEPTMVDPQPTSAVQIIRDANTEMQEAAKSLQQGGGKVTLETVKDGAPPANEPVPRSDNADPAQSDNNGIPELQAIPDSQSNATVEQVTPPAQINEVERQQQLENAAPPAGTAAQESSSSSQQAAGQPATGQQAPAGQQASSDSASKDQNDQYSTSKKKEKKGLRKIVPF
jgi:outer membrane protein assembly factor BamD